MSSRLADFDYSLPPGSIAQEPAASRDEARLLVLERASGRRSHRRFLDLPEYLRAGDVLVLNETRVFPARLHARRASGGRVELLLLEPRGSDGSWRALGRPGRALRPGERLELEGGRATVRVHGREGAEVAIELESGGRLLTVPEVLGVCEEVGEMPLPPYIHRAGDERQAALDRARYQTVYARATGAVAAPTAGLHFSTDILRELEAMGVRIVPVTLHVGLGTFQPLTEESFHGTSLHAERVEIGEASGEEVRRARREGRRIVAVGTTSVRVLESFGPGAPLPFQERTAIFIKPGHAFRSVDALITNFHLPRSSTLVLACAFAGREALLDAYAEAAASGYRFYSYGDAMLIV